MWLPTVSRLCFHCAYFGPCPLDKEVLVQHYFLTDEDLVSMPSFRFWRAPFRCGYSRSPFLVRREHTLYDTREAAGLVYERTGVIFDPRSRVHDSLVLEFIAHLSRQKGAAADPPRFLIRSFSQQGAGAIEFAPRSVPRYWRRNMTTILAPWITSDGAKTGVFCAMCLYTNAEQQHY